MAPSEGLAKSLEGDEHKDGQASTARTIDTTGSGATFGTCPEVRRSSGLSGSAAPPEPVEEEEGEAANVGELPPLDEEERCSGMVRSGTVRSSLIKQFRGLVASVDEPTPVMAKLQALSRRIQEERAGYAPPASHFVDSARGQTLFGLVVLLNAAFLGIDLELTDLYGGQPEATAVVESLFLVMFWAEILLRMRSHGVVRSFHDRWAPFDLFVTVLGSLEAWVFPLVSEDGGNGALGGAKALRVLRLARLLRVVRVLRSFKELTRVLKLMLDGTRAIAFLTLFFFLIMFVSSCLLIILLGDNKDPDVRHVVGGGLMNCMWWHMALTTGEGWVSIWVVPLGEISVMYTLYLMGIVVLENILLVNMMIGAIATKALKNTAEEDTERANFAHESKAFKEAILKICKANDRDGDGIDQEEFTVLWETSELQNIMKAFGVRVDVPPQFFFALLGFEPGMQVTYMELTEAAIRLCGSHSNIRAFMLQYEVSALKSDFKRRSARLAKMLHLDLVETQEEGSSFSEDDDEDEEWKVWEVSNGTFERGGDDSPQVAGAVSMTALSTRHSTFGALHFTTSTASRRSVAGRRSTKTACLDHEYEFLHPVRERLQKLEEAQERLKLEINSMSRSYLGSTVFVAPRCTNGHPLVPIGSSSKPINFAQCQQWTCDGYENKVGCHYGPKPAHHLTGCCRYHCPLCRYDLCEYCYRACLSNAVSARHEHELWDAAVDSH